MSAGRLYCLRLMKGPLFQHPLVRSIGNFIFPEIPIGLLWKFLDFFLLLRRVLPP